MIQKQNVTPDLFPESEKPVEIIPARKLSARAAALYVAPFDHFQTRALQELQLGFDGIDGDFHAGATRRSGGREPWYPRGTEMRNERQVSIVAADELAVVAKRMGLAEIKPEWIGANLVIEGVPHLSMLPSGTLLFFKNGVTIKVDAQNGPCRIAGRSVAENAGMADREAGALAFPKAAKRLRGLVAWVEKPGSITVGEEISVRVPEQWIYRA
jgi:MOSC domain-containing protein YiiM